MNIQWPGDGTVFRKDEEMPAAPSDDTSFEIDVSGLKQQTVYVLQPAVFQDSAILEHDIMRLAACLQGLINRDFQTNRIAVYWNYDESDPFWLEYMQNSTTLLKGFQTVSITGLSALLITFKNQLCSAGMIAWDPAVPATANVASTICGLDGYLPVKYETGRDSLYQRLVQLGVPQKQTLVGLFTGEGTIPGTQLISSGSAKCDAYLWAMEKYMFRCSTRHLAYMPDGAGSVVGNPIHESAGGKTGKTNSIPSHDYLVAQRCFWFDLTCYDKEAPCDDPAQPVGADAATLKKLLRRRYDLAGGAIGEVIGFPPWWLKYTQVGDKGEIGAVALEWLFVETVTAYNVYKQADAAQPCWMTNASLYMHCTLKKAFHNSRPALKKVFDKNKKYYTFYVGDYDSSAWMKQHVFAYFQDPARGTLPLMWAFNPNLSERFPLVFNYIYENKTDNDFFTAGEGAGYITPSALIQGPLRELPTALDKWVAHSQPYFKRFDMDITGFIINGHSPIDETVMDTYNQISPVGSFHNDPSHPFTVYKGTPYMNLMTYVSTYGDLEDQARIMYQYAVTTMKEFHFCAYRTIVASPTSICNLRDAFEKYARTQNPSVQYEYVDPYTFFDLAVQSREGEIVKG